MDAENPVPPPRREDERRHEPRWRPVHPAEGTRAQHNAVGCLRFLLYLAPGPSFYMLSATAMYLVPGLNYGFWLVLAVTVVLTIGMGIFDAVLSPALPRRNNALDPAAVAIHALTFVLLQVLIAPAVVVAAVFAMCTFQ